jgi:hypothetical protein
MIKAPLLTTLRLTVSPAGLNCDCALPFAAALWHHSPATTAGYTAMIVIEDEKDLLKVHVYGELTLADFKELESSVTNELREYPQVNLLLDFTNMSGFTLDVAWEDIQFNRRHVRDYKRIAVITDNQWLTWITWLSGVFAEADVQTFPDIETAAGWLKSS